MKVRLGGMPKQRFYHGWLYNRFGITNEPKVSVKIDVHDTWSMDHSLAHIVVIFLHLMAIKYNQQRHFYPDKA